MRILLAGLIYFGLLILLIPGLREIFGTDANAAAWVQGVGSIGATSLAGFIAVAQTLHEAEQRKLDRTIAACDKYEVDPTIASSYRDLYGDIREGYLPTRIDAVTFLNYLESLAYGANNDLYDYGYVIKHIPIAEYHDELLDDILLTHWRVSKDEFDELTKLRRRLGGKFMTPEADLKTLSERPGRKSPAH
jgi:hypothetical protein